LVAHVAEERVAGPAAEHRREVKRTGVGRRRRVRTVVRAMVRSMMRERSTTSSSTTTSGTSAATTTTSSRPLRTSSALVLLGSNFFRVGDVQSLFRRAAFTSGSCALGLGLLLASARLGSVLAGEPRTPDEAIGLRRWRRAWGSMRTAVIRTGSTNSRTPKGKTGHERRERSFGLVVNATAGCLVGIKVLDKVPEVHVVVWVLVWTHDESIQ